MDSIIISPVTYFLGAAKLGEMDIVQSMAAEFEKKNIPYASVKNPDGYNALHFAAAAGQTSVCKFLIENLKMDINGTANNGDTPLLQAVRERHRSTTIFLINRGADVSKLNNSGETPLHHAAAKWSGGMVKLLVSNGADLQAISSGRTALDTAVGFGNREVLECLLTDLKANPNPASSSPGNVPPLSLAMNARSIECVEVLLRAGADPNRTCYQKTPLIYAACVLDKRFIQTLLKAGADPNLEDFVGMKPLEYAAWWRRPEEVVEVLFSATSRIAGFPDWSVRGVMKHVLTRKARVAFDSKMKKVAEFGKGKGGEAFGRRQYMDAVQWYSMAADADPKDAKVLSNRSLCFSKMVDNKENYGGMALKDALACIALEPGWAKGHYREGAAWMLLGDFRKAKEAYSRASALDPANKDIQAELSRVASY